MFSGYKIRSMTGVNMKKLFFYLLIAVITSSCSNSGNGELIGVQDRPAFYQAAPYGMVIIPLGSFTMGSSDQDVPYAHVHEPKVVSVQSFYMDETEITNNEYRQFVYWVRDSLARLKLGELNEDEYLITENEKTGEVYDPPLLNWDIDIDWVSEDEDVRNTLEEMYYPSHERFYNKKQIDTRKLIYQYSWIDLQRAARKTYERDYKGYVVQDDDLPSDRGGLANRPKGFNDRSYVIEKEDLNIYPDTLCWIHDFSYSYNDPMAKNYFWHPTYDNYPVVGVTWKQAKAFSYWRTDLMNSWLYKRGEVAVNEFVYLPK